MKKYFLLPSARSSCTTVVPQQRLSSMNVDLTFACLLIIPLHAVENLI